MSELLALTFPEQHVVVKDQMLGFRPKSDRFVLLVEVFGTGGSGRTGQFVVKIGPPQRLEREIKGWQSCKPPGLVHDLVFLPLAEGSRLDNPPSMSLVYGDAQQFLGVTATITLEQAVLECVRSGFPKIASIGVVINELFERIGHLLYSQAFVDDPARAGFQFDLPKLLDAMEDWESENSCLAARRDVNALAASGVEQFLDPVDYLRYIQAFVPWRHSHGDEQRVPVLPPAIAADEPGPAIAPRPEVADLVPRLLRGCAHGDLHGRNILVGVVRDQAMWPTVFDYDDMSPCNLIGWDFVKLETELKIRSYLDVFGGAPAKFIHQVQAFEIALGLATEEYHRNRSWPEIGLPFTPEERLRAILLAIRRTAAQQLGANPGRPNDWLEEYYFLLACYGVYTGRFENLQPRERLGALISAGVATARLNWPRGMG